MADEFQIGSGNWWESSRARLESNTSPSSSALSGLSFIQNHPIDSHHVPVSGPSNLAPDPNLQIIGLGLSSQPISDWNQTLLRGGKAESNYQQETGMGSSTQDHWTQKLYTGSSEDSSINDYKQINPGLSLDHSQFSPQISTNNFQMDPNSVYGGGGSSATFQGLLGLENQQQGSSSSYGYPPSYGETLGSWSKFPQFLGNSPPKQTTNSQLQFSNSTQFWNPNPDPMNDVRPSFFPSSQSQFSPSNFEEKPKNISDVKDLSTVGKKNSSESSSKRARNEAPSPLPAFKVRKEKMGDRITALQQLVSPFGKTDTASVLSEAIEYIKFLHEQVSVLSNPYMKSGASMHHHQNIIDKSKDSEGPKQDLRSRGLCLVPVSSTFPVTHETTVDFWTPTFGGTFR